MKALLITAVAAATLAGTASGQVVDERIHLRADSATALIRGFVNFKRARLGVVVSLDAGDSDRYGALIESVSPGGPADRAGVRSGDIVISLDGESMLDETHNVVAEDGSSLPGLRLIALTSRLEPEDTVDLRIRRDDRELQLELVTEAWATVVREWRTPEGRWGFEYGRDSLQVEFERDIPRVRARVLRPEGNYLFVGDPLFELELAPMNEELGSYFGTASGVLVISVPESSSIGLKAGDVVLTVDGRVAESPSHLHRILRSYEANERFRLTIMRRHQRTTVEGTLAR